MNVYDYLNESCIKNDVEISSMEDALDILAELHFNAGNISDKELFKSEVEKREREMSTALLEKTALPHAKSSSVIRPAIAKITLRTPISWNGREVSRVYMLASPDDSSHIKMISALADSLQNGDNNI